VEKLIMLSSLLLRLGQTLALDDHVFSGSEDYVFPIENLKGVFLLVNHDDEGFDYRLSNDGGGSHPLTSVTMLNNLLLYGEET
jgi:hypothetical protein